MRLTPIVLPASLLLLGPGPAHAGDAKKDQAQLQGAWVVTELIANVKPAPSNVLDNMKVTVAGDKLTLFLAMSDGKKVTKVTKEFRFKLDPMKSPRAINL